MPERPILLFTTESSSVCKGVALSRLARLSGPSVLASSLLQRTVSAWSENELEEMAIGPRLATPARASPAVDLLARAGGPKDLIDVVPESGDGLCIEPTVSKSSSSKMTLRDTFALPPYLFLGGGVTVMLSCSESCLARRAEFLMV